jgi:hypothetical protein
MGDGHRGHAVAVGDSGKRLPFRNLVPGQDQTIRRRQRGIGLPDRGAKPHRDVHVDRPAGGCHAATQMAG